MKREEMITEIERLENELRDKTTYRSKRLCVGVNMEEDRPRAIVTVGDGEYPDKCHFVRRIYIRNDKRELPADEFISYLSELKDDIEGAIDFIDTNWR